MFSLWLKQEMKHSGYVIHCLYYTNIYPYSLNKLLYLVSVYDEICQCQTYVKEKWRMNRWIQAMIHSTSVRSYLHIIYMSTTPNLTRLVIHLPGHSVTLPKPQNVSPIQNLTQTLTMFLFRDTGRQNITLQAAYRLWKCIRMKNNGTYDTICNLNRTNLDI